MSKLMIKAADDAFNARIMDSRSLRFAPDLVVDTAGRGPIDLNTLRRDIDRILVAFPDLRLQNSPYELVIAEGNWTCTVAEVTGTHTGPLEVLEGFAWSTLPPTNKAIRLSVCRVMRWKEAEIAQMKVFVDLAAAARQLGLA